MDKFYGQRTCTLDATTCTSDYYQINHTTVAEMLYEENLLHEIDTIQISTCHRYISLCFKTRELLLDFCEHEHTLLTDTIAKFTPDYYDRTRISVENLPIELPDEDVKNSYQLMYNLLEKPTILEKDTIINTIQLERESTNVYI